MKLAVLAVLFAVATASAAACTCAPPRPGETRRDYIQSEIAGSQFIFEGTVHDMQMKSPWFSAAVGDLVPAASGAMSPHLNVTFDVARSYRGPQQSRVSVETGFGGGDCGYPFQLDQKYLVFAYSNDETGQLVTGICTETGLVGESTTALSILRDEPEPAATTKLLDAPASKICGKVIADHAVFQEGSGVTLLRRSSSWPVATAYHADVDASGAFCIKRVDDGKYLLVFMTVDDNKLKSFSYYPGVTTLSAAKTIDVRAGYTLPPVRINVPSIATATVSGRVILPDGSPLPDDTVVALLSTENPFGIAYPGEVAADGSFSISNVAPGTYWAFAAIDDSGDDIQHWFTRKSEVKVERSISDLTLELVQK
jgi:hypothetical protein